MWAHEFHRQPEKKNTYNINAPLKIWNDTEKSFGLYCQSFKKIIKKNIFQGNQSLNVVFFSRENGPALVETPCAVVKVHLHEVFPGRDGHVPGAPFSLYELVLVAFEQLLFIKQCMAIHCEEILLPVGGQGSSVSLADIGDGDRGFLSGKAAEEGQGFQELRSQEWGKSGWLVFNWLDQIGLEVSEESCVGHLSRSKANAF